VTAAAPSPTHPRPRPRPAFPSPAGGRQGERFTIGSDGARHVTADGTVALDVMEGHPSRRDRLPDRRARDLRLDRRAAAPEPRTV
jgi:hypothetical protein